MAEIATEPHAIVPMKRSSRTRRPTSQLMAAPASGAKMIILSRLFSIRPCQSVFIRGLQFQNTRLVDVQRLAIAKDRDDDSQTHRGLSRRHRHHDEHEQLPGHVLKETRKRNE